MKKWWYAVDFSLSQSIEFEVQIDKIHPLDFPLNQWLPAPRYLARGYRGSAEAEVSYTPVSLQETKKSGERRRQGGRLWSFLRAAP